MYHVAYSHTVLYCTVGVSAQENGDVRLAGGNSELRGRVELFLNGVWGTVEARGQLIGGSRMSWAADAICRQLGFPDAEDRGDVEDMSG